MEKGVEAIIGKAVHISRFKQQVMEELQAQWVYTALIFLPPMVASSSHISGDEEKPDYIATTNVGNMVNAPSSQ